MHPERIIGNPSSPHERVVAYGEIDAQPGAPPSAAYKLKALFRNCVTFSYDRARIGIAARGEILTNAGIAYVRHSPGYIDETPAAGEPP